MEMFEERMEGIREGFWAMTQDRCGLVEYLSSTCLVVWTGCRLCETTGLGGRSRSLVKETEHENTIYIDTYSKATRRCTASTL